MNNQKRNGRIEQFVPEWIWEVLIVVTVVPAILHGVTSVLNFPLT